MQHTTFLSEAISLRLSAYMLEKKSEIAPRDLYILHTVSTIEQRLEFYARAEHISPLRGGYNRKAMYQSLISLADSGRIERIKRGKRFVKGSHTWHHVLYKGNYTIKDQYAFLKRIRACLPYFKSAQDVTLKDLNDMVSWKYRF